MTTPEPHEYEALQFAEKTFWKDASPVMGGSRLYIAIWLCLLVSGGVAWTKVIVPSVYKEWDSKKPEWTSVEMQKQYNYSIFQYQRLDPTLPNYIINRGTEGAVYLKYIVDHYHNFPDVAVFVHAHPEVHSKSWLNMIQCVSPNVTFFNINEEHVCRSPLAW